MIVGLEFVHKVTSVRLASMTGRWICGGGVQQVRVVHGDGQVYTISPPVKVADVLSEHPHHYICHMSPELPSNKSAMLSLDCDLEPGYVYFLLPLPRLFPTSSAGPPSCCCHSEGREASGDSGHQRFGFSPLRLRAVQHVMERMGSPMRPAKKKVSPELSRSPASSGNGKMEATSPLLSPTYGSSKHSKRPSGMAVFSNSRCSSRSPSRSRESRSSSGGKAKGGGGLKGTMRDSMGGVGRVLMEDLCKWKPRLGCISETDAVVTACEELRLCLDRRRLTFDAKVPRSSPSPVRLADVCRLPARERLSSKLQKDESAYQSTGASKNLSLGNYMFL